MSPDSPDRAMVNQALALLTDALGIGECTCVVMIDNLDALAPGLIGVRIMIEPEPVAQDETEADIARKVDAIFDT